MSEGRPLTTEVPQVQAATFVASATSGWLATTHDVRDSLGQPDTVLVDCLTPELYQGRGDRHLWGLRRGHIPGSVNVPYLANVDPALARATAAERAQVLAERRDFTFATQEKLAALYSAAGITSDKRVITYCGRGYAAACGALALKLLGHGDVRLYDGSWTEWSADPSLPAEIKTIAVPRTTERFARKTPLATSRVTRQVIRTAPKNLTLVNPGLRQDPKRVKPVSIAHDAKRRAGRSGWMHRYRPFYFRHDGHRWRRDYYSYALGGLWYWYWYDVVASDDPGALVYSEAVLPVCALESDECIEAGEIIAPAIAEGRATDEAMARCAAEFRSFDARTGTYVRYGGEVRICPYLE